MLAIRESRLKSVVTSLDYSLLVKAMYSQSIQFGIHIMITYYLPCPSNGLHKLITPFLSGAMEVDLAYVTLPVRSSYKKRR